MSESVTLFQLGYRRAPGSPREWRRVRGPRQPGGHGVRGHSGEVSLVEGEIIEYGVGAFTTKQTKRRKLISFLSI